MHERSAPMTSYRILMTARYLPPEYSGAAGQAFLLADRLRRRGHAVEFVTQSWRGGHREYEVDGFRVTALASNLEARHPELSLWRSLLSFVWRKRREIDVLHSHGAYYTQSIVGPLGRLIGKPSLVKASLADNDLKSLTGASISPIHRLFLGRVDAYVAISATLEAEFAAKGLRKERIVAIPNGVDMERFRPASREEKRALAQEMGVPADRPIGLFVGVFDERKRIAWLMEQWVREQAFGTGARLLAVGPTSRDHYGPELKADLTRMAEDHPDLLAVRDFTPQVERYYRLADFFVFPSSNEGLPNAVLEAMSCGLPCVATRVSGSTDLIRDGETGATFGVGDSAGLARAVQAVQGECGLAIGESARRFIGQRYDIERIAGRYEQLYERLARGIAAAEERTPAPETNPAPPEARG